MKVAVLIPAYDEEGSIARVVLKSLEQTDTVIVCDDGSLDLTARIASGLGADVIAHDRNLGYGATLSTLFMRGLKTDADIFITLDADGQHDPSEIPSLLVAFERADVDIALGSRFLGRGSSVPGYRGVGIRIITDVSNRINATKLTDSQSGFRAYRRKALEAVIPSDLGMGASTEILLKAAKAGLGVAEVPVTVSNSGVHSTNPVYHGVEVLFSSIKHLSILHPLIIYGVPGLAFLVYGLYLGSNALRVYEKIHEVIVGQTLIAIGSILMGLILGITALIIWIMITLIRDPQYRNAPPP